MALAKLKAKDLAEWRQVFPRNATENYVTSVTFMKQLTTIAVSTITYIKEVFPDENFIKQKLGGIDIMSLKNECPHELAQFLSKALIQAFDAFDKKYLQQMVLCFYEDECINENLLEYHIFEYKYNEDGKFTMSINSDDEKTSVNCTFDDIREKTMQLLRGCVVSTQNYKKLPERSDVSIRLYYNEDAPDGYQAPGYLAGVDDEDPIAAMDRPVQRVGWVSTNYHKLKYKTYNKDHSLKYWEATQSTQHLLQTQEYEALGQSSAVDGSKGQLRCVCNITDVRGTTETLLTCQYCRTQQHATCYGVTSRSAALVTSHCCVRCYDSLPTRAPTDRRLADAPREKRVEIAIFRHALILCSKGRPVSDKEISNILKLSPANAMKLIKSLRNSGIIKQGSSYSNSIIHDKLKATMAIYFNDFEENQIVNRLMTETFVSQESVDAFEEFLSPLEKESLQNASNLGRVIDNTPEKITEDKNLNPYREAFTSLDKDDDEPLSWPETVRELGKKRKADNNTDKSDKAKIGVKTKKLKLTRK